MASPAAGAKRPRPMPTDLDLIAPGRLRLDLTPQRPRRTVLHLLDSQVDERTPRRSIGFARKALDLRQSDPSLTMNLQEWIRSDPPRGIPWTHYPVVGAPAYALRSSAPVPFYLPDGPRILPCPLDELPDRVDEVVVHLPPHWSEAPRSLSGPTPELLLMAQRMVGSLRPLTKVHMFCDGEIVGGADELRAHAEAHAPRLRFRYSYAANFSAIAYPALERALATPDPEAVDFQLATSNRFRVPGTQEEIRQGVRRRMPSDLNHPFALQLLYDLRSKGGRDVDIRGLASRDAPWKEDIAYGRDGTRAWTGTGKHAPIPMPEFLVGRIAYVLSQTLLLRLDGSRIHLSRTAEAFLDAIHPDCMDLDLPMRWTAHPPTPEDRESMDAWIARRFRRMKTRVNALGIEPGDIEPEDAGTRQAD